MTQSEVIALMVRGGMVRSRAAAIVGYEPDPYEGSSVTDSINDALLTFELEARKYRKESL